MATENSNVLRYKYVCTCGDAAGIYAKTMYLSSLPQSSANVSPNSAEGLTLRKKYEDAIFENKEEFKDRTRMLEKDHQENLDEKDRIIKTLRNIITDMEKQMRDQETKGSDGHWSSPNHSNTGPLQRLLEQIERLQKDKQKLLRSLAEFKVTGSAELLIESPLFQSLMVQDQKSHRQGRIHGQEEIGQCTTDTEKELEQTIKQKQVLENEMQELRLENRSLRLQLSKAEQPDANHNYQQVVSRLNGLRTLKHVPETRDPHLQDTNASNLQDLRETLREPRVPNVPEPRVLHLRESRNPHIQELRDSILQQINSPNLQESRVTHLLETSLAHLQGARAPNLQELRASILQEARAGNLQGTRTGNAHEPRVPVLQETRSSSLQEMRDSILKKLSHSQGARVANGQESIVPTVSSAETDLTSERPSIHLNGLEGAKPLYHFQESRVSNGATADEHSTTGIGRSTTIGHDGARIEEFASLGRQIEELKAQLQVKAEELQRQKKQFENQNQEKNAAVEAAQAAMAAEVSRLSSSVSSLTDIACHVYREFQKVKDSYLALREQMIGVPLSLGSYMVQIQKQVQQSLSDLANTNREVVQKYLREMKLRKKYHNELVELRGNIRVLCRVRPYITEDGDTETDIVVTPDLDDDGLIKVNFKGRIQNFDMDKVFGIDSTQAQIFEEVSSLVRSVIDGFNVCIFAYGQTGSGKTYTMEGPNSNPGINQRALQLLFEETKDSNWQYEISASVLEIYNEAIRDLLNPDPHERKEIKMNQDGGYYVPGLVTRTVTTLDEVNQIFKIGRQNRATAATNMNEHSSRSHCLLCVTIRGFNPTTSSTTFGRLNLVDLAGSERVGKSQADGARLKEAQNINRSLACLGDVIHALRNKHSHVPYRNSKLTFLLQDSLGGDSKTLMIVQVSPVEKNVAESLCTLSFGQRVKSVALGQATRSTNGSRTSSSSKKSRMPGRPSSLNVSTSSNASLSHSFSASSCNSSHNSSFASEYSSSASSPTLSLDRSQMSSPFFDFNPVFSSSTTNSPSMTPTCRTPTPSSPTPLSRQNSTPKTKVEKAGTRTPTGTRSSVPLRRPPTSVRKSTSTPNVEKASTATSTRTPMTPLRKQNQSVQRSATFTVRGSSAKKQ